MDWKLIVVLVLIAVGLVVNAWMVWLNIRNTRHKPLAEYLRSASDVTDLEAERRRRRAEQLGFDPDPRAYDPRCIHGATLREECNLCAKSDDARTVPLTEAGDMSHDPP